LVLLEGVVLVRVKTEARKETGNDKLARGDVAEGKEAG
jgi:hypothetical protein